MFDLFEARYNLMSDLVSGILELIVAFVVSKGQLIFREELSKFLFIKGDQWPDNPTSFCWNSPQALHATARIQFINEVSTQSSK